MASPSLSSESMSKTLSSESMSNTSDEMSSSEDGISEVTLRDQGRTVQEAECSSSMERLQNSQSSSFMEHLNKFRDDKGKGKAIMSGTRNFDEIIDEKVVTPNIFKSESTDKADTNNVKADQEYEMDGVKAPKIQCRCCCWELQVENMVHCSKGHMFCFECFDLNIRVKEIIYGDTRLDVCLTCWKESIPFSEIRRGLPKDVNERYEDGQAQEAVAEANLEGLKVYCPFCNVPYELEKCLRVLHCRNRKCLKASCIKCKKLSHPPFKCEEGERMSITPLRREVEERMAKAVIKECNNCHLRLVKEAGGCNEVKCRCGNTMCYLCRQTISSYIIHFCFCYPGSRELGKPCPRCNRTCRFQCCDEEDNEALALAAKEEALKELVGKEPKLLDLEIGPPFEKLRQELPIKEHCARRIERSVSAPAGLLGRAVMPEIPPSSPETLFREVVERALMAASPCLNSNPRKLAEQGNRRANICELWWEANMVESPISDLFSEDIQFSNMVASPPSGFQAANMVESPPFTPSQLWADEDDEPTNLVESPPFSPSRFFTYEDDELTNMVEPESRLSRDDEP